MKWWSTYQTCRRYRQTYRSTKENKDIDEVKDGKTTNVTNNSLFVGSTSDLQKILKDTMKNK